MLSNSSIQVPNQENSQNLVSHADELEYMFQNQSSQKKKRIEEISDEFVQTESEGVECLGDEEYIQMEDTDRSHKLIALDNDYYQCQKAREEMVETSEEGEFIDEEDDEELGQRKQREAQEKKQKEMEAYDFKEDDPEVLNAQLLLKYAQGNQDEEEEVEEV